MFRPSPAQRWGRSFYRTPKASEPGYTRDAQASTRAGLRALGPLAGRLSNHVRVTQDCPYVVRGAAADTVQLANHHGEGSSDGFRSNVVGCTEIWRVASGLGELRQSPSLESLTDRSTLTNQIWVPKMHRPPLSWRATIIMRVIVTARKGVRKSPTCKGESRPLLSVFGVTSSLATFNLIEIAAMRMRAGP